MDHLFDNQTGCPCVPCISHTDGFDWDMSSLNTVSAARWSRLVDIRASLPEIWNVEQLVELAVGHVASFFDADCCVAFLATEGRLTAEVSVTCGEGLVTVSVKDDGMGIPLESQPHIFEPFFRGHLGTPQDYGGLGVGLYISREIVRRLGGDMGFSSRPGKGSTFHFTLTLPA